MMRTVPGILLGLLVLTWCSVAVAQTAQPLKPHLDGPGGPYRGRVLDAETGKPLAGVVVVAVWRRDRIMPFHSRSEHYAAREALTNADGEFVIDADDVERNAPKRTWHPFFTIFLPGFGRPRAPAGTPPTLTRRFYEGPGNTIELPKLKDKEERLMHLRTLSPYGMSESPFIEIPEFTRLFNQERVTLGLEPYPSSGRQP
jgi:hypothetical protein